VRQAALAAVAEIASVRVFVILDQARLVSVWMGMGLPVVAVFVLVLDVVVVVQDVGMRMRLIPMGVLMGVLCGHHLLRF
jgi:TRAP-type uncharacterized transport system fused permease subunit